MSSPIIRHWLRIHDPKIRDMPAPPVIGTTINKLLLEDGFDILLENDDFLLLESSASAASVLQEDTTLYTLTDIDVSVQLLENP